MSTDTIMRPLVIGPRELVSGLSAFGVEVRPATTKQEALEIIRSIREHQAHIPYAIIFLTETIAGQMDEKEYESLLGDDLPVVLTIPDLGSDANAGLSKLKNLAKRAVGVDIFS